MKALTICQPYAELICLPETDPRHKRVENREWSTNYRGLLYIHAGKNRSWLNPDEDGTDYGIPVASMAFGAVVAIATLGDCVHIDNVRRGMTAQRWPWLAEHPHTEGTWCWILRNVQRVKPIPWKGAQGLWDCDAVTESLCIN